MYRTFAVGVCMGTATELSKLQLLLELNVRFASEYALG